MTRRGANTGPGRIDRALRTFRSIAFVALLAGGLGGALAPQSTTPAESRVIHFRDATPGESLLHDLYAQRDRVAAEREARS